MLVTDRMLPGWHHVAMENHLRAWRLYRDLTQDQLAALAGTSKPQISRLERSDRRLTTDWLQRLATPLKCSPAELLGPPPNGQEPPSAPDEPFDPRPLMKQVARYLRTMLREEHVRTAPEQFDDMVAEIFYEVSKPTLKSETARISALVDEINRRRDDLRRSQAGHTRKRPA